MGRAGRYRAIAAGILCASLLGACQPRTASVEAVIDPTKEADVLRASEIAWSKEIAGKDPAKMAARFASGAPVYQGKAPLIHGPQGIRAAMARAFQDPAFKLEFTPDQVNVAKSGDMAWITGAYKATSTDPKTKAPKTVEGAYLTVYGRNLDKNSTDKRWLITAIFTGAVPPTPDDD